MLHPLRRHRGRWIAALTIFLTLAGGGVASAHWTASAQSAVQAAAARVGMTQTMHPAAATTPLATTYSASSLAAAGAVSVGNTGSRQASFSVTVRATSATSPALPGAIRIVVGTVGAPESCTPTAALGSPRSGTLSTSAPFVYTGTVAAGATAVLCVQTSMSAADASTHANQSVALALQSQLSYADAAAWKLSGPSVAFTQSVASSLLFFSDSSGRYIIRNQGICVMRFSDHGKQVLARSAGCGSWSDQWRMSRNADGTFFIAWAQNSASPDGEPRWTALTQGQTLETRAADTTAQRWSIRAIAGSEYRIESVAHPGQCVTIGTGLWNPGSTDPLRLVLAPCRDAATQRFTFDLQGTPIRPVEDASCARSGQYLEFGFSPNPEYQQEIAYRALLAREATPESKAPFALAAGDGLNDGWNTYVRVRDAGASLAAYVDGAGGVGNTWIFVEQRIGGSAWTTAAKAKFHIARSGGQLTLSCGWR